jgi:hypothetical protein
MKLELTRPAFSALALALFVLAPACSKKKEEEEKAKAAASAAEAPKDPNADGKRLERSLGDWQKRWQREPEPPSCTELLKEAAEQKTCTDAAAALTKVKQTMSKPDRPAIQAAADLAVAASAAEQVLRQAVMAYLASEGTTAPVASGVPSGARPAPPPPRPVPSGARRSEPFYGRPGPAGSAVPGPPEEPGARRRDNPYAPLLRAYGRLARQSLRYLGVFLEQGPEATRRAALAEAERIAPTRERWRALGQVVRQAALVEKAPDLKTKMSALEQRINPLSPRLRPGKK